MLGRWLLPPRCLACGAAGHAGRDLCQACAQPLPWLGPCCARCALPLPRFAPACGECLRDPPPFCASHAALRYAPPVDRWLSGLKFRRDLAAGRLLSQLCLEAIAKDPFEDADVIVPVPLHARRLAERGYNQALELARPLARALGLALEPDVLQRLRATAAQTELDREARRRNLRGAFAADTRVDGRRVLLLDDVVTTGATVREAARALLAAGAARVAVFSAARAAHGPGGV